MENVYTVPEVAEHLKLSKSKVYAMVKAGKIPCIRIGRNVRILESDLVEWIEAKHKPDDSLGLKT